MQEDKRSKSAYFITLTYATKHLRRTPNNFRTLRKADLQLFFKRLRKRNSNRIKYYAVGEYGGIGKRPHYHVIMFNVDIATVSHAWQLGTIHYGTVTAASVGYCLKYLCKPKRPQGHVRDDRQTEFALMSKRLGDNYINAQSKKWHHAKLGERMYCVLEGGVKVSMPRYYKDKIYSDEQRRIVANCQADRIAKEQYEERQQYGDDVIYWANKAAAIKASFASMYSKALYNRNKI